LYRKLPKSAKDDKTQHKTVIAELREIMKGEFEPEKQNIIAIKKMTVRARKLNRLSVFLTCDWVCCSCTRAKTLSCSRSLKLLMRNSMTSSDSWHCGH
jgi:hypothetical protein